MTPPSTDPVDAGKDLVLVFTDMESSSKLWESEGSKFYSTLQAHMDLLQDACRKNGGRAVKSTGDGFFMAFERPDDAIRFAVESQIDLSLRPDLPGARVGIDIGTVFIVTEPGNYRDYVGPAANRAARICALAAPRTVLVSERVANAVGQIAFGAKLELIGNHNLRNIGLETIYLLKHERLSAERPDTGDRSHVLPWVSDLFVGRDSALEKILINIRAEKTRCVSIVGFGGMGKTRLSLEAARRLTADLPDGIAFAELDGIRDGDVAWSIIAGALRSIGYEGEPKPQDIGSFLLNKAVLLILDGVEGLPRPADIVEELLRRTQNLKLLVTSRNRLKIPSVFVALESLPLNDAITLLLARMEAHDSDIAPAENSPEVKELCRRLDCIPLSIELAAARAGIMTPAEMLQRIESRFSWMTDSSAPETGHRRSLEATIGWSFDLLTPSGQTALKVASLFSTGFRLDVWERLMGPTSLEALGELQRSSLVATETRADQPGKVFYLLETIRLYASERLKADVDLREDVVNRFAGEMLEMAQRGLSLSRTPAEGSAFRGLDELAPNLHSALSHLVDLRSELRAAKICEVLAAFHHYRGRNRQARDIAKRGLTFIDSSQEISLSVEIGLLRWLAASSLDLGDAPTAAQAAFTLLQLAESLPVGAREREEARAHNLAGLAFTASVEPRSADLEFEIALAMAEELRDRSLEGMVRHNMGWLAFCHGELELAAGHLEAARVLREGLGDLRGIAETSSNMGLLEQGRQNLPAAALLHDRSLTCWSSVFDLEGVGKALFNLAECFESMSRLDSARAYYAGSLVMFERSESQYVDLPREAMDRLADSDAIKAELSGLEPGDILESLRTRFDSNTSL